MQMRDSLMVERGRLTARDDTTSFGSLQVLGDLGKQFQTFLKTKVRPHPAAPFHSSSHSSCTCNCQATQCLSELHPIRLVHATFSRHHLPATDHRAVGTPGRWWCRRRWSG